jgi:hypothetical protein
MTFAPAKKRRHQGPGGHQSNDWTLVNPTAGRPAERRHMREATEAAAADP